MILHDIFEENIEKYPKRGQDTGKVRKWTPQVSKSVPKGTKSETKGSQSEPKGSQKGAKGSQKAAKGCQKGAKGEPTGDQNASKSRPSEKVEKMMENGGVQHL